MFFFCPLEMFNVLFAEHTSVHWMLLSHATRPGWGCHMTLKWTTVEWSAVFAFKVHFHSHLRVQQLSTYQTKQHFPSWLTVSSFSISEGSSWWSFLRFMNKTMISLNQLMISTVLTCAICLNGRISQSLSEKCPGHISPPKK